MDPSKLIHVFEQIPFNRMLGLKVDSIDKNYITIRFEMRNDLIGNFLHGILHGGVISSVLDMVGGVAAMVSVIEKMETDNFEELASAIGKTSTINLNVNFLRPGKGEYFIAKSSVKHGGKKLIFTTMELHNQEFLIASGSGTYLIA